MHEDLSLNEMKKEWHGSLAAYLIGFFACLILTGTSFILVLFKEYTDYILVFLLVSLAIVQAVFQLLCFLHVGQEAKPRWETMSFYFMATILIIIVAGSIIIMYDLNDRMMEMK